MLAIVMPSPVTPYWSQTLSALMLATPHSTASSAFLLTPSLTLGTCTATGA